MSFKCNDCDKTIRRVEDIRSCERCNAHGRASAIPSHHEDSDWLTPGIIGYMLGSSFSHQNTPAADEAFEGGGGSFSGAGASGTFEDNSSGGSPNDTSSDSSPSSDSSSSDGGSSGSSDP